VCQKNIKVGRRWRTCDKNIFAYTNLEWPRSAKIIKSCVNQCTNANTGKLDHQTHAKVGQKYSSDDILYLSPARSRI